MTHDAVDTVGDSSLEEKVEAIWREVLDVPEGQRDVTFMDLGGQSVAAVLIATRIGEELNIPVEVADLFDDPTLETFVRDVVAKARGAGTP
ncbi:phosphopantetheine-binding protein [Solwaraspora sp. WMMD791]|uniref:phosphopantetheine-binding protein n=1 Tax=Solwaraspora sp. WMMD791 TaxID=3016086 RepID=UPI00249A21C2|nr:phosphopantetheine-binding protein [Solwaraspora sp. WMMD791]WFE29250.1 phosphopantetheine-binding protein [Solwaraspora sp. WMMD791]